jgi:hypothetical protein
MRRSSNSCRPGPEGADQYTAVRCRRRFSAPRRVDEQVNASLLPDLLNSSKSHTISTAASSDDCSLDIASNACILIDQLSLEEVNPHPRLWSTWVKSCWNLFA